MPFKDQFNAWMTRLGNIESPDRNIVAFHFGLFETTVGYSMYLIGARVFDEDDEDLATEIDYEPEEKYLEIEPSETIGLEWNEVLDIAVEVIREYVNSVEFNRSIFSHVSAVTIGFDDGDLIRVK